MVFLFRISELKVLEDYLPCLYQQIRNSGRFTSSCRLSISSYCLQRNWIWDSETT